MLHHVLYFDDNRQFAIFNSLGKNPLLLDTQWEETSDDYKTWSRKATVKIFKNEEEYNQYRNANKTT